METREETLAALGVSAQTVLNTLQTQNAIVDAGRVNIGDYRMRIAPSGTFTSPADIADLVVRPSGLDQVQSGQRRGPELLRLGEIVEVKEGYTDPPTTMMRYNGLPSIGLAISFQSGVNVVSVGEAVDARVNELIAGLPVGIEVERVHWQSDDVNLAVSSFLVSLGQAVAIVLSRFDSGDGCSHGDYHRQRIDPDDPNYLHTFGDALGIDLQRMSLGAH